jgi:ABC-type multidrug transport system ATPase subunit
VLSVAINSLPVSLLSSFIFATIIYWMTGFTNDAGRYFFFVLVLVCHELATAALFRFYGFVFPTEELAAAAAGITTGSLLVFGGFYIAYPLIPNYFLSIYYLSPFSWSVRSMCISEFTADPYMVPISPFPNANLKSDVYLDAWGFFKGQTWKWGGVGYCLGFALLVGLGLSSLVVHYVRFREAPGAQRLREEEFRAAAQASAAALGRKPSSTALTTGVAVVDVDGDDALAPATVLPFSPVTLSFSDITYSVALPNKTEKPLLRGLTGCARPGTLTALMGASGAGKTTLLDVLAFRKTVGKVGGAIFLNATPATAAAFAALSGFAEQSDVACDFRTVAEAVAFSARLRLPTAVDAPTRAAFAAEVLELLELTPLAARRTGALSQGEAKRLTIAVELAANPALLFLDEPTSGLDARAAAVVCRVLRRVADTGRTVVCTIHQPSAAVFFAFDELLCLAPGGVQTFAGPLGARSAALVAFLQACPGVAPLREGVNPASWMLEEMGRVGMAAAGEGTGGAAEAGAAARGGSGGGAATVAGAYAGSALAAAAAAAVDAARASAKPAPPALRRPALPTQFAALLGRWLEFGWRNTAWNGVRLFTFTALAVFFGLLYRGVDDSNTTALFAKLAVALNGQLFLSIIVRSEANRPCAPKTPPRKNKP